MPIVLGAWMGEGGGRQRHKQFLYVMGLGRRVQGKRERGIGFAVLLMAIPSPSSAP